MLQDFFSLTRGDLEHRLAELGTKPAHARDMFRNVYKSLRDNPWTDEGSGFFPLWLGPKMASAFATQPPELAKALVSAYDGSVKFLVRLADGAEVESVLMPETNRITLCLSSQVGCAQGCVFCHTGRMGLKRHLTAGEIVGQVVAAERWLAAHPEFRQGARMAAKQRVSNIVFMGMGEPLDNVDAVAIALAILTDPYGLALGIRRISVSTAGHLDGLEQLVARVPGVRIALSVHSTDDAKRSKIMPINKRWPLALVVQRLRELRGPDGPPVLLQYTMIKGVNDSLADAAQLAELTAGLNAKVNLIPLNPVGPSRLAAPSGQVIQDFRDVLHAQGIRVMVRYSKGQDIAAACGQLVLN